MASDTPTSTETPTPTATSACALSNTTTPLALVINEVAWAGTRASSSDEWIELYNPPGGLGCVILTGWVLRAEDGSPTIPLTGTISDGGYFLLEHSETTVSDLASNQLYSGALSNSGEKLYLENNGNRIDTANIDGGVWPAGGGSYYASMERLMKGGVISADSPTQWLTNTGVVKNGLDKNSNAIYGTPRAKNWAAVVTPTPSRSPTPTRTNTKVPTPVPVGRPVINEFLPRPGFDWNQDGKIDVFDEFIEIKNLGPVSINLKGWMLDDVENSGSAPFTLPDLTLKPGERAVFYGLKTNILLSDGGDAVRLLNPKKVVYDSYTYPIAKVKDQAWCRLPDGVDWYADCRPTPNEQNSREGSPPQMPAGENLTPLVCNLPDTLPQAFYLAECTGFGANVWSRMYWDAKGAGGKLFFRTDASKWEFFVE
ncbi:MAG: lamin tail domain-containing protein [Anaerolineales bacterium]|nr:lamin tail domain-containing protein [Anaerolineales bacterium]